MKVSKTRLEKIVSECVQKYLYGNKRTSYIKESRDKRYVANWFDGIGWNERMFDSLEDAVNVLKHSGCTYFDISDNTKLDFSETDSLIAWGGEGGYWHNMLQNPNIKESERDEIMRKKKKI